MTENKVKQILDNIYNLQEYLLSIPDDIWLNINPRDNKEIEKGTEFIKSYNQNLEQFTEVSSKLAEQIKEHFQLSTENEEIETEKITRQSRDRIVKELNKKEPHTLDENFTYKRPYGFILENTAYKGLKTWRHLFVQVLEYLKQKDSKKFENLINEKKFISSRGHPLFNKDGKGLRESRKISNNLYVETNFSANHIRNYIKELLQYFAIKPEEIKIFLREDRDA